ncbi:proline--tRNA ligase [Candidatus Woesearchaeota archaeon]|nr:proline--tRNA ligase [Candidatus Woesearchaeota archaeon]
MAKQQSGNDDDKGITVKKEDDMAEWYGQVVTKSEIADYSPVRGCMIIRPLGYAVWEKIQQEFNKVLKNKGVKNAYFPLFIPESFFRKEAEHAEGFAPEVAWIENKDEGGERLAVRPTSETIMYDSYSRWIRSWRDLPVLINQWANVCRWETSDCKIFLRSREFLWQEGHNVFETEDECEKDVWNWINEYKKLAESLLAVPMIVGKKTEKEKFAGAVYTTTIEGFMPDGKSLQCGTSHHLGQGFAKSFSISFLGKDEKMHTPWQDSWGFSTRLIGAMIMMHGDNKGLVLPPKVAQNRIVIVPILFKDTKKKVLDACHSLLKELKEHDPVLDDREEYSAGWKFSEWELKGVPLRIELGPKDLEKKQAVLVRRDTGDKIVIKLPDVRKRAKEVLDSIQEDLLHKAKRFMDESIVRVTDWDAFMSATGLSAKKLVLAPFCGEEECEDWIKDKTKGVTARAIKDDEKMDKGARCIHCGKDARFWVYFARAY